MQYRKIKAGTTDVSVILRVVDSTDGTPETSVAYNTAGIDLQYRREGAASTAITEATQTASGAHSDGGFVHIGNGYCRLDLPDAACASGASGVLVHGTITGMIVIGAYIDLEVNDNADVYGRLGAPAGASVSADVAAVKSDTAAILTDTGTTLDSAITTIDGIVDAIKVKTDYLPSATAGSAGGVFIAGSNAATSITTALTANITGSLSGSVGSVTGAVGSVTGNVGGNVTGSVGSVTGLTASDVGAIKTKTDSLTFTVAGEIDANIQSVNGVALIGDGSTTPWGPA